MRESGVAARFIWLCLLGLAIGWFEGAVVVYLRQLYYPDGFRFPIVIIPNWLAGVELVREAASLLLLAAAARLAGVRFLERLAAFMLLFGIWDLVYYGVLKLVLDWPASLATWDLLFLLPVPWVGPVWAPCLVSLALVGVGGYLYLTSERDRGVRWFDWVVVSAGGLIVTGSFVANWRAVIEERPPEAFPAWLFWAGFLLAVAWFVRVERRAQARRAGGSCGPASAA